MAAKMTKVQIRQHERAVDMLAMLYAEGRNAVLEKYPILVADDEEITDEAIFNFVHDNYSPQYHNLIQKGAIYFTPLELAARAFNGGLINAYDSGRTINILDLCGGIGALSFALLKMTTPVRNKVSIVIVENNPEFVEVGRKLMPWATWIQANVQDLRDDVKGKFDHVIANPPFGITWDGKALGYDFNASELVSCAIGIEALKPGGSMMAFLPDSRLYQVKANGNGLRKLDFSSPHSTAKKFNAWSDDLVAHAQYIDLNPPHKKQINFADTKTSVGVFLFNLKEA